MSDFKFNCPHCKQSLEAPEEMLGLSIDCPGCNGKIEIPVPEPKIKSPPIPPSTQTTDWYYNLDGQRNGPISDDGIKELLADGTLSRESLVWKVGFDNWVPIAQTTLKMQIATVPPPLPCSVVKNGIVWTLAFFPIWGVILNHFIAKVTETDPNGFWFSFSFVALNTFFCFWDKSNLQEAGHDTKKFAWSMWLVPVYLFKRARALNQSLAYFITWMICFSPSLLVIIRYIIRFYAP